MKQRMRKAEAFITKSLVFGLASLHLLMPARQCSSAPFVLDHARFYHLDKVLLYSMVFYLPFAAAYLLLKLTLNRVGLGDRLLYPAMSFYLLISVWLCVTQTWCARGMEIDSRSFYLVLLFAPVVLVLVVLKLVGNRDG